MFNRLKKLQESTFLKKYGWWVFVISLVGIQAVVNQPTRSGPQESAVPSPQSIDTLVPLGFQLIPIKIINQEEVSALVQDFALVDLYVQGVSQAVANAVRLIRSPLNPEVFAVLVPQEEAPHILQGTNDFFVALRNPEQTKVTTKKRRRFIIEDQ